MGAKRDTAGFRFAGTAAGAVTAALLGGVLAGAGPAGAAAVTPGIITTVAGGVGGPAKATTVAVSPCGARFSGGSLYVGDIAAIRRISPASDQLTTPVGTGSPYPLGDGGPATEAGLNGSCAAVLDHAGNLVVADIFDNRIRVVAAATGTFYGRHMTAGDIYTVAGNGTFGFSGDGGPATSAELRYPQSVAVDGTGNLVIADTRNDLIRVVAAATGTFYGRHMTGGDIYTVAGGGNQLGDGGPATGGQLSRPQNVTTDGAGNLLIADSFHDRIRVVAVKTGTFYGHAMTAGDIYTVAGKGPQGFSGDGGPATSAELNDPLDVVPDGAGNLVIADNLNNRVRVVAAATGTFYGRHMTAGDIYTVAGGGNQLGDGGPATSAELNEPQGVAVDGSGNLVIADTNNNRVRVVAAATGTFYGEPMTTGDIYTIAGTGTFESSGDGGPATAAELSSPEGVAVDPAGNVVVADTFNNRIRVAAASTGTFYGRHMTAGDIYTVAGTGKPGFAGDGGPAASAALHFPYGIATDGAGDLLIADTLNSRARMVAAHTGTFFGRAMTAGDIYTIAGNGKVGFAGDGGPATGAKLGRPEGTAVDGAGNLVIADTNNNRIRVVADRTGTFYGRAMTAGDIYTVAGDGGRGFAGDGGPATGAEMINPEDVAADGAGNLVISDTGNGRIRVVADRTGTFYGRAMTAGDIYTVAGGGNHLGDGGPATSAALSDPVGVAADGSGNLVIADLLNSRVRVVAARTGTFYGIAMTAGDIYTVAGDGTFGFSGDGGPATHAAVGHPSAVAAGGSGLVFADDITNRIRQVTG